ncbi:Putative synthase [Cavenderia fasciculata]|uniref:Synthase n=1 Tax=Cavenderia fasciculata TaxID=261658 RepID=F4Q6F4_CACFS|nr:Putative synthase [Cavenderia fasciculata]EGG16464.1 Putative synthase [Cavenderia fasciculata]|eukprot:XP_004354864.1 Putative synthase [Cavenderia fasciculata]
MLLSRLGLVGGGVGNIFKSTLVDLSKNQTTRTCSNILLKCNQTRINYTSLLCLSLSQHQQQHNLATSNYGGGYSGGGRKKPIQSTRDKERYNNRTLTKYRYEKTSSYDNGEEDKLFDRFKPQTRERERTYNNNNNVNTFNSNNNNNNNRTSSPIEEKIDPNQVERLQKRLSRSGVTSRRQSERMIMEGRVCVNGKVASMKNDLFVKPTDIVTVDNKIIEESVPKICNLQDPEKDTLIPILQKMLNKDHLMSVGRLDYYSEGLILITNDGELSRYLELPQSGFEKTYRVRIFGKVTPDMNMALTRGLTIDGIRYAPMKISVERETDSNTWVICTLTEGKNREIRRIFEHFNVKVLRIIRTQFGPYTLPETLKPGETVEVHLKDEIKSFKSKWANKEKLIRKAKEGLKKMKLNQSINNNININNNEIEEDNQVEEEEEEEEEIIEK